MSGRELLQAAFEQGGFPIYLTAMSEESLRDYFAGQALVGLSIRGSAKGYGDMVKVAYKIADAMMEERAKREGEDE
jgi:hypothetical protein